MAILPKLVVQKLEAYKGPMSGRLDYIRLDFGENTDDFPEHYPQNIPANWVSAYPEYGHLIERIADYYAISPGNIMLTNGSDEGIFIVANTFIEPGHDKALVSKPCFVVMPHSLSLAGAELIEVPVLEDLSFDLKGIEAALAQKPKLAMFATPENPTGAVLKAKSVLDWCKRFPDTLFMIDEAYVEFAAEEKGKGADRNLLLTAATKSDNLIVLRTFSKAWAMAGLRLGIMVASESNLAWLNRVRLPFSVNAAAVWTALKLMENSKSIMDRAAQIRKRKEALVKDLSKRGYSLIDGQANSFLLSLGINAERTTSYMKKNGLLVRNRSASMTPPQDNADPLWGMVRISTGKTSENERLLTLLSQFNKGFGLLFDLDGTLVDTTTSYDTTVEKLIMRHSGNPLKEGELNALRAEGGYNDDWQAARELLHRRGIDVNLDLLAREAEKIYLEIAAQNERVYFEEELLEKAAARHPLFIVTGRTRREYDPIWGKKLDKIFKRVYCVDDLPDAAPKPAPDFLLQVKADFDIEDGIYVGNSVDDMQAARKAGMAAVGICSNLSAEILTGAGAQITLKSVNELTRVLSI